VSRTSRPGQPLILRGRDLRMAVWIVRAVDLAPTKSDAAELYKRPNAHGAWDFTSNSTVGSG